jgi:hypothetical protein
MCLPRDDASTVVVSTEVEVSFSEAARLGSGAGDAAPAVAGRAVLLAVAVRGALAGLGRVGLEATVEEVTDYAVIAGYGVMSTPALVVDDTVVLAGRVPTVAQVRELLMAATPTRKA